MISNNFVIAVADILFGVALMDTWNKPFLKGIGGITALVGAVYVVWYLLTGIRKVILP